jgi:hypothetical protein
MVGYPYTYGDTLTEEEVGQNVEELVSFFQENPVVGRVASFVFVTFLLPWLFDLTAFAVDDKLVNSLQSKSPTSPPPSGGSCPAPTTLGLPRPRTPLQRALNTGAIGTAIGVLCVNAMWIPSPIAVSICLAAFTGYVVPPAWAITIILRGIRAGTGK